MLGHTLQQGSFLVEFFFPVKRLCVSGLFDAATLVLMAREQKRENY